MCHIFSMAGLSGKQNPKRWYSAPEANEDTLEMLLNLVMAILCFSPSCLQSHTFLCISSLSLDLCGNLLLVGSSLVPFFSCVALQLSVASPILYGTCPLIDWCSSLLPRLPPVWTCILMVRAAVSCAWSNHVAPPIVTSHGSVKRQGPPSTHPPASPSQSHALEQNS